MLYEVITVKVVQKIPVKIVFENSNDPFLKKIRAGLNAEVDVHIDYRITSYNVCYTKLLR